MKLCTMKSKFAEKYHQRCQLHLTHFIGFCHWTSLKVFSKEYSMWCVIIWGAQTLTAVFFWEVPGAWVQGLCGSLVSVLHLLLLDVISSASLLYLLTTSHSSLSPSYFCPWQNEMMGKIPACDASCLLSQRQIKVGRHNKMIPF